MVGGSAGAGHAGPPEGRVGSHAEVNTPPRHHRAERRDRHSLAAAPVRPAFPQSGVLASWKAASRRHHQVPVLSSLCRRADASCEPARPRPPPGVEHDEHRTSPPASASSIRRRPPPRRRRSRTRRPGGPGQPARFCNQTSSAMRLAIAPEIQHWRSGFQSACLPSSMVEFSAAGRRRQ